MIDEIQSAKQIGDNPVIKDYTLLATLLGVGILWFLKIFTDDETKKLTLWQRISKALYGSAGSVLATWLVFELLFAYTNLPLRLAITIAAVFGYIGAETSIRIGMRIFGKKFNVDLRDLEKSQNNCKINEQGENNG